MIGLGAGAAFCCGRFSICGLKVVAWGVVTVDAVLGLAVLLVFPISVGLILIVLSRRSICVGVNMLGDAFFHWAGDGPRE